MSAPASSRAAEQHRRRAPARGQRLGRTGSIEPFDLELHAGEVVGLAGLLGLRPDRDGRLLFGIDRADAGHARRSTGTPVERLLAGRLDRARRRPSCPEDRKAEGIVADLTVRENIILAIQAGRGWLAAPGAREQDEIADRYIELLQHRDAVAPTSRSRTSAAATSRR